MGELKLRVTSRYVPRVNCAFSCPINDCNLFAGQGEQGKFAEFHLPSMF